MSLAKAVSCISSIRARTKRCLVQVPVKFKVPAEAAEPRGKVMAACPRTRRVVLSPNHIHAAPTPAFFSCETELAGSATCMIRHSGVPARHPGARCSQTLPGSAPDERMPGGHIPLDLGSSRCILACSWSSCFSKPSLAPQLRPDTPAVHRLLTCRRAGQIERRRGSCKRKGELSRSVSFCGRCSNVTGQRALPREGLRGRREMLHRGYGARRLTMDVSPQ